MRGLVGLMLYFLILISGSMAVYQYIMTGALRPLIVPGVLLVAAWVPVGGRTSQNGDKS